MSTAAQRRTAGEIRYPIARMRMRQIALFMGMLLSGGLLVIPREPLLIGVLLISFALTSPAKWIRREYVGIYFVLIATVAVALVGGQSFQIEAMIVRYANFFGGLALLAMYFGESRSTLANDLYSLLKLMCFQALLTPIAVLVAADFITTFESGEITYYTVGYVFTYHDTILDARTIKRPDGFFFEPGVLQIYLNIFVFICLFVRKQSAFDIALGTLAVISTQSTTGAVVLAIQYGFAYFHWVGNSNRRLKLFIVLFAPIILMPVAGYAAYNTLDKFTGEFSGSAEAREYDLVTGLRVVAEHPLTGIGFDDERYFDYSQRLGHRTVQLSRDNITERGNTNGVVTLLFSLGIPLGMVFLFGLFRQRMFTPRLLFGGIIALSLLTESLFLKPFFLMIAFSGLLLVTSQVAARGESRRSLATARNPGPAPERA